MAVKIVCVDGNDLSYNMNQWAVEGKSVAWIEGGMLIEPGWRYDRSIPETEIYDLTWENFLTEVYGNIGKLQEFRGNVDHTIFVWYDFISHARPRNFQETWKMHFHVLSVRGHIPWHRGGWIDLPGQQSKIPGIDLNDHTNAGEAMSYIKILRIMST